MLTNAALIARLRKPGKIRMPVLVPSDVAHITVEKADVIDYLQGLEPAANAPWQVVRVEDGFMILDTQD